ncbi:AT hook motif DNA-binding family protein [Salvia divinorum]|uniref:AT-hook motif nuclear-localized protein n=1 Tax=Salvia divinorum TaxID=28513 RepID=A0ABD1FHA8_SALDI
MDPQDSSAPPPHHHHHPQQPPPLRSSVLHSPLQRHLPNNFYPQPLPDSSNTVNPTTTTHMHQQSPGFPFHSIAPLDHLQPDGCGRAVEPARKKRGRPRKYSPDNSIGLGLSPAPVSQLPSLMAHNDSGGGGTPSSENSAKRNRGRPPGSVKRQLDALGVPGVGFTPHVITVNAGEDIASKIMAFTQQGPRTVCILSANGAICNVTLHHPAMSGGTVKYEGRFEIISLSGSFLLSESNGTCSRTGGLSISLAGSDGKVLGGGVAGMLNAASPVQIVVGSFIAEGKKSKIGASPRYMFNFGAPGTGASPSPCGSSESGDDSPLNHGTGPYGNDGQEDQTMPLYNSIGWPNSMKVLPN